MDDRLSLLRTRSSCFLAAIAYSLETNSSHGGVIVIDQGDLLLPQTIDSISAYGEVSISSPSRGDCVKEDSSKFNALFRSSAVKVARVGEACEPEALVGRVLPLVWRARSRWSAATERVIGAESSAGSTLAVTSPNTWIKLESSERALSLGIGELQPRIVMRRESCSVGQGRLQRCLSGCRCMSFATSLRDQG
jgi:hypothetical protein